MTGATDATDATDADGTVRVGETRPGGRAARVRADVLAATSTLLLEVGYDALTIDEVANRAGVHRTTVYRRWPTKPELVAAAAELDAEAAVPLPDTGTLAGDLLALARSVTANVAGPDTAGRSLGIVAAAATTESVAATLHRFMDRRVATMEPIVERAVVRGELAAGTDPRAVIEPVVGAIWFRLVLTGAPIDAAFLRSVVAVVSSGAAASGEPN